MVKIEDKIDSEDLPTRILRVFKQKVVVDGIRRNLMFFFGDNGKAYNMRAYSRFLGLGETALHHRIVLFGCDHENMLLNKEEMNKVKGRSRSGNPTKEYLALSDDETAGNKRLEKLATTKMDDLLFPSRQVNDSTISVRKALLMVDGVKKENKGWNL